MKTSLITLFLALVLSTNVNAKKVEITSSLIQDPFDIPSVFAEAFGGEVCTYTLYRCYFAAVHTHRANTLGLQLLSGDMAEDIYGPWPLQENKNTGMGDCFGEFTVENGQDWSLNWVLATTKGKGRVVDAREVLSGSCQLP